MKYFVQPKENNCSRICKVRGFPSNRFL